MLESLKPSASNASGVKREVIPPRFGGIETLVPRSSTYYILHQGFATRGMGFNDKFALQKTLNSPCPVWVTSRHSGTPIYAARLAAVALITQGEHRPPSAIGLGPLEEHD